MRYVELCPGRLEDGGGVASGDLRIVETQFVVICDDYNRQLDDVFMGQVNFFGFFFGSGDRDVWMVFICVAGQ